MSLETIYFNSIIEGPSGPEHLVSYGRNGGVRTCGVQMVATDWGSVTLTPITSRGLMAENNNLRVPLSHLPAFIRALQRLQYHSSKNEPNPTGRALQAPDGVDDA